MKQANFFSFSALSFSLVALCVVFFQKNKDTTLLSAILIAIIAYLLPLFYFGLTGLLFSDLNSISRINNWGLFGFIGVSLLFGIFSYIHFF